MSIAKFGSLQQAQASISFSLSFHIFKELKKCQCSVFVLTEEFGNIRCSMKV